MNTREYIEKVAAGLRRMSSPPDFLLFCSDNEEELIEIDTICNIPVLYSAMVLNTRNIDVDFIPLWKNREDYVLEVSYFNHGYLEEGYRRKKEKL